MGASLPTLASQPCPCLQDLPRFTLVVPSLAMCSQERVFSSLAAQQQVCGWSPARSLRQPAMDQPSGWEGSYQKEVSSSGCKLSEQRVEPHGWGTGAGCTRLPLPRPSGPGPSPCHWASPLGSWPFACPPPLANLHSPTHTLTPSSEPKTLQSLHTLVTVCLGLYLVVKSVLSASLRGSQGQGLTKSPPILLHTWGSAF